MFRHLRVQLLVALLGMALVGALLTRLASQRDFVYVPDRGGTYIEGVAGRPSRINPLFWQSQVDRDLVALVFSGLTRTGQRGEIIPDLAESWDVDDSGRVYIFHLRSDARWHDGAPVTADDVVFTVQAIQDPAYTGSPDLKALWTAVTAEAMDGHTVRFVLEEPFAPFLSYTTLGILPAHLLADIPAAQLSESGFNRYPVGTGPFRIQEVTVDHALLETNPYSALQPYLSHVELRFYPDRQSALGAYERGQVMGVSQVLPEDLGRIAASKSLRVYSALRSSTVLIILNLNRPVFQDRAVRQALLFATDREQLVQQVVGGEGVVAHSPVVPHSWAYHPELKRYEYNPQLASDRLEDAGWVDTDGDGIRDRQGTRLEFVLATNDDPLREQLIGEISRQWRAVGVLAHPVTVGNARLAEEYLRSRRFDAVLYGWDSPSGDPALYPLWHSSQADEDGQNFGGFASEEADVVLERARQVSNKAIRLSSFRRFQEIFAEEVPAILLYHPVFNFAVDESVHGVQLGPVWTASDRFRNIDQWYVRTTRVSASSG